MVKLLFLALTLLLSYPQGVWSVVITRFANPGDSTPDTNSSAGVGAFGFDTSPGSMNALQARGLEPVALSPDVAAANNLTPGQQFSITTPSGVTFTNLVYADQTGSVNGVPLTGRIDFFDPNNQFGGVDGAQVATINGGPVLQLAAADGGGLFVPNQGGAAAGQLLNTQVVNPLLQEFKNASAQWAAPLKAGISNLFYLLALISLVWTGYIHFYRSNGTPKEFMAMAIEYVLTISFFYWVMINGETLANAILSTLRILGGKASGRGQDVFPADLITIGLSLINAQVNPILWLLPQLAFASMFAGLVVFALCCVISANLICLIISAWIMAFAGVVVLGFGGSPWTRDIAINYLRSVLGVGLQLFTMELVMGLGVDFLNTLVQQMGGVGAITNFGSIILMFASVIILAVLSHRLPIMVASMVTGSAHHSGIGTLGLLGAGLGTAAAINISGRMVGGAGAAVTGGLSAIERIIAQRNGSNGNGASTPQNRA